MRLRLSLAALAAPALLTVPALAQTPATLDAPDLVQRYQATITPSELAGHLYVYADDYLAGRDTGEPGQRFASLYIAGQYKTMGIGPKGTGEDNGNHGLAPYLQPFELEQKRLVSQTVTATRGSETVANSQLGEGLDGDVLFAPAYGQIDDASAAPLIYIGYASDDEMEGLDLDGAYVMMQPGTPDNPGDRSVLQQRAAMAGDAGARAVIVPFAPTADALAGMAAGALRGGRLALPSDGSDEDPNGLPPILGTGMDVAATLLGTSLTDAQAGDTGLMMTVETEVEDNRVPTENVLAYIEGSDLKDEVIVISGHLDHNRCG